MGWQYTVRKGLSTWLGIRRKLQERVRQLPQWYWFFIKLRPFTSKYVFLFLCIIGLMWHAVYTNYIIMKLKKNATISTQTYAKIISVALTDSIVYPKKESILFEDIAQQVEMPLIICNSQWEPVAWKNIYTGPWYNKKEVWDIDRSYENIKIVTKIMQKLRKNYEPHIIFDRKGTKTAGYVVFGNSDLLSGLTAMPIFEAIFIIVFFAFVFFALQNIMMTEKGNLWVGLARETAHQLGTPISSLMGWVEYMRSFKDNDESLDSELLMHQVQTICGDMQKDITRLQKIASRFSQIGSKPSLTVNDINEIIKENVKYFRTRLPMLGKHIELKTSLKDMPKVAVNKDLLEWVFENLFKNSVDAIEQTSGLIEIKTEFIQCDNIARILHIDNGKGITWDQQRNVFAAGYTTKNRGWGLGLTLAKRIIEDYHKGHIYIAWSHKGKGTAFSIDLPVERIIA